VGDELHFFIKADGFTYKMVRSLVGTMLEAGRKRLSPPEFAAVLRERDRRAAGPTAPAHGLTLLRVFYPPTADPFGETG
jgi:tRNA pseudouridine38-40 synthase